MLLSGTPTSQAAGMRGAGEPQFDDTPASIAPFQQAIDPNNPPEGFIACFDGQCHASDGSLIIYDREALEESDIRLSASGKAYYVDSVGTDGGLHNHGDDHDCDCACEACARFGREPIGEIDGNAGIVAAADDASAKVPITEVPVLNSYPSSSNTFYLDFTGGIVTASDWTKDNGGNPIHAVPYDRDGDQTTFSGQELADIDEIWRRVSEDFAPFDINVTTVEPDESEFRVGRGAIRAMISTNIDDTAMGGTGDEWFGGAGGVAFISSWNWAGDVPVWVFYNELPNTAKAVAEAVSHEFGHAVGLSHDGVTGNAYYEGHGEGETGWAPIMGAAYHRNVTQWSRGEYDGANNRNNDIETITHFINKIEFREDDHGQANEDATPLTIVANVVSGSGVIENERDYDVFSLVHSGGPLELTVSPPEVGPNVDVLLELFDADDDLVAESAPLESLSAQISLPDAPAGTYYLLVDGDGYLPDGGEQGYSDYASIGSYNITGLVGNPTLTADAGGPYRINEGGALSLDGSASVGPSGPLTYRWDLDRDGAYDDATGVRPIISWAQLGLLDQAIIDDGVYQVSLLVSDESGGLSEDRTEVFIANVPPQASLSVADAVFVGSATQLTVEGTDIPADSLKYEWTFGDGTEPIGTTESTLFHTYQTDAPAVVQVRVMDDEGAVSVTEITVFPQLNLPRIENASIAEGDVVGGPLRVAFEFNQDVSDNLTASALTVFNLSTNQFVTSRNGTVEWFPESNTAEFRLPGLPAGTYEVVLVGGAVVNSDGLELDGDGDGDPRGNWNAEIVVTFDGDADHDLDVDFSDFLIMAANFGTKSGATWATGDFDADGEVGFADFLALANNFGVTEASLPRPA